MQESILVNGKGYDFAACRLDCFGLKRVGFTSIDFSDKLERGEGRGASQVALAVSRGKYVTDPVKIKFHATSGDELRQHVAAQSRTGKSIGSVEGTIVLQLVDDKLGVLTYTFAKCMVNVPGTGAYAEGSELLVEDWEFYVRLIDRNGITLYESDEAGAQ